MLSDQNFPVKGCAIYTRKCTSHRHEHDVCSLVTQQEISSSNIRSQQPKVWVELPQGSRSAAKTGSGTKQPDDNPPGNGRLRRNPPF